jgi:sporulation protein YlmC with PRC-barrel domain
MAAETEFTIGAKVSCADGSCGEIRRIIIDPATETVTHLVVQPGHRQDAGRLVPTHLVETTTADGIRLRCTLAEFNELDHAEERELAQDTGFVGSGGLVGDDLAYGVGGEAYAAAGPFGGELINIGPVPGHRKSTVVEDVVPLGEDQVRPGDRVYAADGEIGRVRGFLVNPENDRVTHVLLQEGHLWGRKEIAIPVSAVAEFDAGVRLNITKEQVGNLAPAG